MQAGSQRLQVAAGVETHRYGRAYGEEYECDRGEDRKDDRSGGELLWDARDDATARADHGSRHNDEEHR